TSDSMSTGPATFRATRRLLSRTGDYWQSRHGERAVSSRPRTVPSVFFHPLENHFRDCNRIASGGTVNARRSARANRVDEVTLLFLNGIHRLRISLLSHQELSEDVFFPIGALFGRKLFRPKLAAQNRIARL